MSEFLFVHSDVDEYGFDPFERAVVDHIKRRGSCREAVAGIAAWTRMSERKAHAVLRTLVQDRVLQKQLGNPATYSVNPPSVWIPRPWFDPAPRAESMPDDAAPHAESIEPILHHVQNSDPNTAPRAESNHTDPAPHAECDDESCTTCSPILHHVQSDPAPRADKVYPISKSSEVGKSPKRKKRSVTTYDHESLQYLFSATFFERLVGLGKIAESTVTEKKLQAGADAFDRVTKIKPGYSWEEIQETMHWLLQRDNWWMAKRAILSPTKLMEKHDKNDCTYFETIRAQFLADSEARHASRNGRRGSGSIEDEIAKTVAAYSGVD